MTTPTTPAELAAFPNRRAVEREIHAAENPAPGAMHLNDGHERVRLPGGTLRRMLAAIDALAALATQARAAADVPDGYVIVPVEPTQRMLRAHADNVDGLDDNLAAQDWHSMLSAAPPAPAAEVREPATDEQVEASMREANVQFDNNPWHCYEDGFRAGERFHGIPAAPAASKGDAATAQVVALGASADLIEEQRNRWVTAAQATRAAEIAKLTEWRDLLIRGDEDVVKGQIDAILSGASDSEGGEPA